MSRGEKHTYFMNLGGGMVIDARKKASSKLARRLFSFLLAGQDISLPCWALLGLVDF